jgi:molybdenum-dependent DNA-binding transcriptional regulator ModE
MSIAKIRGAWPEWFASGVTMKSLVAFDQVVLTGSSSKVAKIFGVSPASVGWHLSQLEKALELKLFERGPKGALRHGAQLTLEGQLFHKAVVQVLDALATGTRQAQALRAIRVAKNLEALADRLQGPAAHGEGAAAAVMANLAALLTEEASLLRDAPSLENLDEGTFTILRDFLSSEAKRLRAEHEEAYIQAVLGRGSGGR